MSFVHTWSTSSPEHSPGGTDASSTTPSPSLLDHETHRHYAQATLQSPACSSASVSASQHQGHARRSHSLPNVFNASIASSHTSRTTGFAHPSSLPETSKDRMCPIEENYATPARDIFNTERDGFAPCAIPVDTHGSGFPPGSSFNATPYEMPLQSPPESAMLRGDSNARLTSPPSHSHRRPLNVQRPTSQEVRSFGMNVSSLQHSSNYNERAYEFTTTQVPSELSVGLSSMSPSTGLIDPTGAQTMCQLGTVMHDSHLAASHSGFQLPPHNAYLQGSIPAPHASGTSFHGQHSPSHWGSNAPTHSPQSNRSRPHSAFPSPSAYGSDYYHWSQ